MIRYFRLLAGLISLVLNLCFSHFGASGPAGTLELSVAIIRSAKFQAPTSREPPSSRQPSDSQQLELGDWFFSGDWVLEFGASFRLLCGWRGGLDQRVGLGFKHFLLCVI